MDYYYHYFHGLGTIYKLSNWYLKIHTQYVKNIHILTLMFCILYYFCNFNTNYIIFRKLYYFQTFQNLFLVNINIEFSRFVFWNELIIWEICVEIDEVLWYKLWIYTCMCMYYRWFNMGWKYFWLNNNYIFWLKVWVFLGINKKCMKLLMTLYTCHILQNIWFHFSWHQSNFYWKLSDYLNLPWVFINFQTHHIYLW
jgi:hypothetical protein